MTAPTKQNFKIYQGSTFSEILRWESASKTYVNITNITKAAPMVVTAVGHGMPVGWRAKISNVTGMKELTIEYTVGTSVTTDTVTFNSINAAGYTAYVSGGTLEYYTPVSLAGLTARMQIREKVTSTTTILELTTENGMISLNDSTKVITITIPAATTAGLTFKTAVYSLEVVDGTTVSPLITGVITLDSEITR